MLARKPQAVRQVLPDLLRDLGPPFPALWTALRTAHGPRDAARVLARILGLLEEHGAAVVVPALVRALADGTPPWLALAPVRRTPDLPLDAIPLALRAIEIGGGCAADYDQWLGGVA
jgi:hypothetical protein